MYELTLDADLEELRKLADWLRLLLSEDPSVTDVEAEVGGMELAIHELAVNIVVHGYKRSPGSIRFEATRHADAWDFVLTDTAPAFQQDLVAEPDEPQEHGYGLMIIRQLTRDFSTTRIDNTNITRLTFDAAPLAASTSAEGAS